MTTRTADEIIVAANGGVYVAPVGSTLPTDADTALDAAFVDLGYISEDGVNFAPNTESEQIPAWQSFSPVRIVQTSAGMQASFTLMQWNEETVPVAFGGGTWLDNGDGTWDFDPPAPGEDTVRALVIEGIDGSRKYRVIFPRVQLEELGEVTFTRGEFSPLEVTLTALAESEAPFSGRAWRMVGSGYPVTGSA